MKTFDYFEHIIAKEKAVPNLFNDDHVYEVKRFIAKKSTIHDMSYSDIIKLSKKIHTLKH